MHPTIGSRRRFAPGATLLLLFGLAACGGGDVLDYTHTLEQQVRFTMGSTGGRIGAGDRVTFLRGDCPGACTSITNIRQSFSVLATGTTVPVDFTDVFPEGPSIFVSVYIDKNDSGRMDSGDWVWGSDPTNFTGYAAGGAAIYLTLMRRGSWEQSGFPQSSFTGTTRPW